MRKYNRGVNYEVSYCTDGVGGSYQHHGDRGLYATLGPVFSFSGSGSARLRYSSIYKSKGSKD